MGLRLQLAGFGPESIGFNLQPFRLRQQADGRPGFAANFFGHLRKPPRFSGNQFAALEHGDRFLGKSFGIGNG